MTLIKTSLLNGIAVFVKMVALLGINKSLALFVGPVGYAIIGQFQSAVQMITTFASGAINMGVIRYTAEYADNFEAQQKIWKTSSSLSLIGSLVTAIGILIFCRPLAVYFLKDEALYGVFIWFGAFLPFFVFNTLLLAMLNGKKELHSFVIANIVGSLLSLILTAWMAYQWRLYGALVALGIFQSVAFFVTFYISIKLDWFKIRYLFGKVDVEVTKKLFHYTIMALSSAILLPLCQIYVRNLLGERLGWTSVGYWEAMWKLSAAYLLFLTSTLSVYYLPRLSELKSAEELRKEVWKCFVIIVPTTMLISLSIYFLRHWIISLLFTGDFAPMEELFFWQLLGDSFKICSWLMGFIYIAKGFSGLYVASEILFAVLFYLLIYLLIPSMGLKSTAIAHLLGYVVHSTFIFTSLKIKKVL